MNKKKCAKSESMLQIWSALPIELTHSASFEPIYIFAEIAIFHSSVYFFLSLYLYSSARSVSLFLNLPTHISIYLLINISLSIYFSLAISIFIVVPLPPTNEQFTAFCLLIEKSPILVLPYSAETEMH